MCLEHDLDEMAKQAQAKTGVTRRIFGGMAAATAALAALPRAANAVAVKGGDIVVKTPDGEAESYFVAPAGGKAPAVLVWVDAFGLRPAFRKMADRLAEQGYAVLTPNPYYRTAKVPALPEGLDFAKEADRAQITKVMSTLSPKTHFTDAAAFIDFLNKHPSVDANKKMGTTGYCMGGPMVMRTAATSDRVGGAATFHGGGLVDPKSADSPHLLIPKIKAQILHCIAESDDKGQPDAKDVLKAAYGQAKLKAEVEVYAGTMHGWCPIDAAVYNKDMAEKAWARGLATFKSALV